MMKPLMIVLEKNDAIAKRLLMLAKDKKVAREIFEAGDQVDKHWIEIADTSKEQEVSA